MQRWLAGLQSLAQITSLLLSPLHGWMWFLGSAAMLWIPCSHALGDGRRCKPKGQLCSTASVVTSTRNWLWAVIHRVKAIRMSRLKNPSTDQWGAPLLGFKMRSRTKPKRGTDRNHNQCRQGNPFTYAKPDGLKDLHFERAKGTILKQINISWRVPRFVGNVWTSGCSTRQIITGGL